MLRSRAVRVGPSFAGETPPQSRSARTLVRTEKEKVAEPRTPRRQTAPVPVPRA